ncbi:MAG: DUF2087 domain-containing protein [Candidatus Eisenbacteria bacterium]
MNRDGGADRAGARGHVPPADPFPGIRRFLDADGRLRVWPSKLKDQKLALAWLAARFEPDRDYTEKQVNALLLEWHSFRDWALLRRALVDHGWLERERDGSRYGRREPPPRG